MPHQVELESLCTKPKERILTLTSIVQTLRYKQSKVALPITEVKQSLQSVWAERLEAQSMLVVAN